MELVDARDFWLADGYIFAGLGLNDIVWISAPIENRQYIEMRKEE